MRFAPALCSGWSKERRRLRTLLRWEICGSMDIGRTRARRSILLCAANWQMNEGSGISIGRVMATTQRFAGQITSAFASTGVYGMGMEISMMMERIQGNRFCTWRAHAACARILQKRLNKGESRRIPSSRRVIRQGGRSRRYSAFLGQALTHSRQSMHSVPFLRRYVLSVTSTSMGQTCLHFPQETHFSVSHRTRSSEK